MSLPGLPPLPKSLSGLEATGTHPHNSSNFVSIESQRGVSPVNRKTSTLDTQLAILRREMVSVYYIVIYIFNLYKIFCKISLKLNVFLLRLLIISSKRVKEKLEFGICPHFSSYLN